jgi:hypothetical protein
MPIGSASATTIPTLGWLLISTTRISNALTDQEGFGCAISNYVHTASQRPPEELVELSEQLWKRTRRHQTQRQNSQL